MHFQMTAMMHDVVRSLLVEQTTACSGTDICVQWNKQLREVEQTTVRITCDAKDTNADR